MPPKYCRLFAFKKFYKGAGGGGEGGGVRVTGTPGIGSVACVPEQRPCFIQHEINS